MQIYELSWPYRHDLIGLAGRSWNWEGGGGGEREKEIFLALNPFLALPGEKTQKKQQISFMWSAWQGN